MKAKLRTFLDGSKTAARAFLGRPMARGTASTTPADFEHQCHGAIIKHGDVVYDVGANIGNMAVYFSKLTGPTGRVIAFEPVWPTYVELCNNIHGDISVRSVIVPIHAGISNEARDMEVNVPGNDFGQASLAPEQNWKNTQHGATMQKFRCRFVPLDEFIATTKAPIPDFIKIDVEGAELFVVQSMKGLAASSRKPVLSMELYAPWQRAMGVPAWEALHVLKKSGYHFLFMCPEGLIAHEPTNETPTPSEYLGGYNVIAYCPDRHKDVLERLGLLMVTKQNPRPNILGMVPPTVPNV